MKTRLFSVNVRNPSPSSLSGEISSRVPHLPSLNEQHFGVSVCTVSGQRYHVGNSDVDFCLFSCAKPINYCLALEVLIFDDSHFKGIFRELYSFLYILPHWNNETEYRVGVSLSSFSWILVLFVCNCHNSNFSNICRKVAGHNGAFHRVYRSLF